MVIINSEYRGWRDLPGLQKAVVIFYQAMKPFVRFLPGYQTFCHKSLKVWDTKTCNYDKQKLTKKKSKIIDKIRNYYNIYFIHIYYELITILFIYSTHTLTHTFGIHTIWNYLIKEIPSKISRNK